jgi:putative PIN family toxin of toxin-antitoxin system
VAVVFDSNLWVSAFRFGGVPMAALQAAYLRHTIAYCDEIEAEVIRVLKVKFGWSPEDTTRLLNGFLNGGLRVRITGNLKGVCRDEDDDMVVECALVAKAQMIVSGDKDLLSLGMYSGIQIISPAAYLKQEAES